MRIYVASSWRNSFQPPVVKNLREMGHEVYDFKDSEGFNWKQISPNWEKWTVTEYLEALNHPLAIKGFNRDMEAIKWCNILIMVQPCGCSAFMETGWAIGSGKRVAIYVPLTREPDLMISMAELVTESWESVKEWLNQIEKEYCSGI